MLERERKFLLKEEYFKEEGNKFGIKDYCWCYTHFYHIKQAYLMLDRKLGKQLRVRLVNHIPINESSGNTTLMVSGADLAYFCYKYQINDTDKQEFEYEISYNEGLELYNSTAVKLEKRRIHYSCIVNGEHIKADIDVYPNGLKVVEIEYEGELNNIPEFCGEEITGNPDYSNIKMALDNSKNG